MSDCEATTTKIKIDKDDFNMRFSLQVENQLEENSPIIQQLIQYIKL